MGNFIFKRVVIPNLFAHSLVSHSGHSLSGSYSISEVQSVYSTAPANRSVDS